VYDPDAPKCDPKVLALGIPVLGICYGMQWITHTLGGKVEKAERREYGRAQLKVDCEGGPESSPLFAGAPSALRIWNSHGDHVRALPAGFPCSRAHRKCRRRHGGLQKEDLRDPVSCGSKAHRP